MYTRTHVHKYMRVWKWVYVIFGLTIFYAMCRMEYKIYKTCNNKAEKCNA